MCGCVEGQNSRTSFIIDARNEQSLSVLPLKDVDVVIVAIGENFGASGACGGTAEKEKE